MGRVRVVNMVINIDKFLLDTNRINHALEGGARVENRNGFNRDASRVFI